MKRILIGITGGIGAGKSTVSRILKELGFPVFDADTSAKHLLQSDPVIINKVKKLFGDSVYPNGIPDRKLIASIVYNDKEKLSALNNIIHPAVATSFNQWLNEHKESNILFKEAAILFESGSAKDMDLVIAVDAAPEIRIKRIMKRDGRPESEIRKIIASQLSSEDLKSKSDFVILNDNHHPLISQLQSILNSVQNMVKVK